MVFSNKKPKKSRALFLDRDGVINFEKDYLYKIDDVEFIPEIFDLVGNAKSMGYKVIVITNQSGIARGLYSESQFHCLMDWMRSIFIEKDCGLDAIYYCPFHPVHGIGRYRKESIDRKPNPGMILSARDDHSLDLEKSILVGDRYSDVEAGLKAGVGTNFLYSRKPEEVNKQSDFFVVGSLGEIVPHLKN